MAGKDVLTTRIGETVKVEIKDPRNPHGTWPNYGNVKPDENGFYWGLASGQHGNSDTERKAINAAARALRKHAIASWPVQTAVAHVPSAIIEAVNKAVERYGEKNTKVFYSADGEAVVHYRVDESAGRGTIHFVATGNRDEWVCALHTVPGHVEAGLPDVFVSTPMYDTTKDDWWPPRTMPEPDPEACPACGEPLGSYAISRFDNKTKICDKCGTHEALADHVGFKLLAPGQVDG